MKNSITADGISFRLQDDGSLLLTTPTGQYHIQQQGVTDIFDLLYAGQGRFLVASSLIVRLSVWKIAGLLGYSNHYALNMYISERKLREHIEH